MAFYFATPAKPTDVVSTHDPSPSSPTAHGPHVDSRAAINYTTQKQFQRYLEELVNPKIRNDQPTLVKREPPDYLKANAPTRNPFRYIKFERINELKEQHQIRRAEEAERFSHAHDISEKVPLWVRQRHTAAANLRKLIHEENVKEISEYGRLFEPNSLTAQPVGSKLSKITQPIARNASRSHSVTVRGPTEEATVNDMKLVTSVEETKSLDPEIESRDQMSRADIERSSFKTNEERDVINRAKDAQNLPKQMKRHEGVRQFVQDRRRVCLLELAARTKRGEVNRLDTIMQAENEFLTHEEHELLRKHEEHDRYLKSICQRTAEAIRLAEGEARKRNEITEKIKRARYRLAHLNAECVKLEEEYLRLSTYKEFLHKVAVTFREHHSQLKAASNRNKEAPDARIPAKAKLTATQSMTTNLSEALTRESTSDADWDLGQPEQNSDSIKTDDASLTDFFTSPQDLVDILSELESNNLTLIENVQEQEEVCERVRAKAAKLYSLLNVERKTVDDHIARERQNITGIQENVNSISLARSALSDFVLLERYAKVFYLGDMNQFENLDPSALITPAVAQSAIKSLNTGIRTANKGNTTLTDPSDLRPTISNLLSILQVQIQKVYSAVYGTNEGGARLDTLVMLRRLETTVDELSEMLNAYPRHLVLKAKRTVDERNRVNARRRQKVETQVAYELRLERAIKKAREPPRRRFGRRVLERSRPPEIKRTVHVGAVSEESEEENKSLFQ